MFPETGRAEPRAPDWSDHLLPCTWYTQSMSRPRQTAKTMRTAGTTYRGRAVATDMPKPTSPRDRMPQESANAPGACVAVPVLPFNAYSPLYVTHPNQRAGLVVAMANMPKFKQACSISVHGPRCTLGVVLWPRVISSEYAEHARSARKERDAECSCIPLVMYSGASA